MGTLNSLAHAVQTAMAGVVLSHLTTLRMRFGMAGRSWVVLLKDKTT
jgi:hypothetical protein